MLMLLLLLLSLLLGLTGVAKDLGANSIHDGVVMDRLSLQGLTRRG